MCDTGYSVKRLAEDLSELRSRGEPEPAILGEARELVKRLVLMKHNWLRSSMSAPGMHRLHEAIFVVALAPREETPPRDPGTWTVIAGLEGKATLHTPGGEEILVPGTIVAIPSGAIHRARNDSDAVAVALHVYGTDPDSARG
jgi:quercetin dioxygenase-like cupin family protein